MHEPQPLSVHTMLYGQSLELQQFVALQTPSQHLEPAPQSTSFEHFSHFPAEHTFPPEQSALVQHSGLVPSLPEMHLFPQQRPVAPQSTSVLHAKHIPSLQRLVVQSPELQQEAFCLHVPPQHLFPTPQSLFRSQASHSNAMQALPFAHGVPGQQVPG